MKLNLLRKLLKTSLVFQVIFISLVQGQISIGYPFQNQIFQRNNQNVAQIPVVGTFGTIGDQIQVSAIPVQEGQGQAIPWRNLDSGIKNGIYSGNIQVSGGFYNLRTRIVRNGTVLSESTPVTFGVGEVFVFAGQSNAEGNIAYRGAEIGAKDPRVMAINYTDVQMIEDNLPYEFTPLTDFHAIGPYNPVPWIWAKMADKIVAEENVPVLLFGGALGGSPSSFWSRSANGEDLRSLSPILVRFAGSPYQIVKRIFTNYITHTGARALLWQQGESDANTPSQQYYENVKTVMDRLHVDFGQNISWIVARSSRTPNVHFNVIEAQNRLISDLPSVFEGPNTDNFFGVGNRVDGIHFWLDGITRVGEAWANTMLNNNYFRTIPVVDFFKPPLLTSSCGDQNKGIKISASNTNDSFRWNNGANSSTASLEQGTLRALVRTPDGKRVPFPNLQVYNLENKPPTIKTSGSLEFCPENIGNTTLQVFDLKEFVWSTGEKTPVIKPTTTASYSAQGKNTYGCSIKTPDVDILLFPSPKLSLSADELSFCEGEMGTTTVNESFQEYRWSDGIFQKQRDFSKEGLYTVSAIDQNGCRSNKDSVHVTVFKNPEITISKKMAFLCSGEETQVEVLENLKTYQWSDGNTSKSRNLSTEGTFSVIGKDENGCFSKTEEIKVTVFSLPEKPNLNLSASYFLNASWPEGTSIEWFKDGNYLFENVAEYKATENGVYATRTKETFTTTQGDKSCFSQLEKVLIQVVEGRNLFVFPTPARQKVFVEIREDLNSFRLKIYALNGQLLLIQEGNSTERLIELNIEQIPPGKYILMLETSRKRETQNIIKT